EAIWLTTSAFVTGPICRLPIRYHHSASAAFCPLAPSTSKPSKASVRSWLIGSESDSIQPFLRKRLSASAFARTRRPLRARFRYSGTLSMSTRTLQMNAHPALMVPVSRHTGGRERQASAFCAAGCRRRCDVTAHAIAFPFIWTHHAQGDTSQGQDIMRQPKNRDHPRHVPEHALLYGALRHLEGDITAMAHPLLRADLDQLLLVRRRRMSSLGPGIRHPGSR